MRKFCVKFKRRIKSDTFKAPFYILQEICILHLLITSNGFVREATIVIALFYHYYFSFDGYSTATEARGLHLS